MIFELAVRTKDPVDKAKVNNGKLILSPVETYVLELKVAVHDSKQAKDFELRKDIYAKLGKLWKLNSSVELLIVKALLEGELIEYIITNIRHHNFTNSLILLKRQQHRKAGIVLKFKRLDFFEELKFLSEAKLFFLKVELLDDNLLVDSQATSLLLRKQLKAPEVSDVYHGLGAFSQTLILQKVEGVKDLRLVAGRHNSDLVWLLRSFCILLFLMSGFRQVLLDLLAFLPLLVNWLHQSIVSQAYVSLANGGYFLI